MKTPQIFEFQAPAFGILKQGIKVVEEDVLYNWFDSTTMTISSFGKISCRQKIA